MSEPDLPAPGSPAYLHDEPIVAAAMLLFEAATALAARPPVLVCEHLNGSQPPGSPGYFCLSHAGRMMCTACFAEHVQAVDHQVVTVCACCGLDSLETDDISWNQGVVGRRVLLPDERWARFSGVVVTWPIPVCVHCAQVIGRYLSAPDGAG